MTTENQAKRDKLLAKIRALLSMTEANGCTEAEAMAAASAADKLMQEYDLTYTDVEKEVREDRYGARRRQFNRAPNSNTRHEAARYCSTAVARYFNCRNYCDENDNVVFFGSLQETQMAMDMLAMLVLAMDTELARYMRGPERDRSVNGRTVRASFASGFIGRVCARLDEMKRARDSANDVTGKTGRSLVVVKHQVVTSKFGDHCRQLGMRLVSRSGGITTRDGGSYRAGQAAGGRVDLGGGKVGSGTRMIGR